MHHQLSGLDASFLAIETANATGHIGSVMVIDAATSEEALTLERFTQVVGPRIRSVARCSRKLLAVPLGLDNPYWVDDEDFDIEFHIRELALPQPGSHKQLTEQVARLHARPLDRSRPLWEMYLISGLAGGRAAVYTKLHHAMIDGVAGNDLLEAVLDLSAAPRDMVPVKDPDPVSAPTHTRMAVRAARAWARHPVRAASIARDVVRSTPTLAELHAQRVPVFRRRADDRDVLGGGARVRAPKVPFNAPITPHRRVALAEVSLSGVKEIKAAHGSTVNDVVLSLCAGALRRYLADRDALPGAPLVAAVPVSVRGSGAESANQVSMMMVPLPTDVQEADERLRSASAAARVAKERFDALPATMLMELYEFSFPALANQANRLAARLRLLEKVRPFNLIVSNIPGPRVPLFIAGAELLEYYPVSALPDGQGLNITVFSYRDSLFFGLLGCRELVPDLEALANGVRAEYDELHETSAKSAEAVAHA